MLSEQFHCKRQARKGGVVGSTESRRGNRGSSPIVNDESSNFFYIGSLVSKLTEANVGGEGGVLGVVSCAYPPL